jgi:hypothetical protein
LDRIGVAKLHRSAAQVEIPDVMCREMILYFYNGYQIRWYKLQLLI